MAQGVNKLVKFMLFFFNFIFFLCGLTILIGVSLTFAHYDMYNHYIGKSGLFVLIVLLIVGVFIFFTGFLGCCGALRENYCMLLTYAIIIFGLLLVEIVAGIAGFVFKSNISDEITKNMEKELLNYPNATNATKEVFDTMQETLKCCGTYNYTDWFGIYRESPVYSVPVSCCINPKKCNNLDIPKKEDEASKIIYTDGCADKLKDTVQENMMAIIIVCIVIGLIEIIGIFCSCGLMRSVKNEYEVV